MRDADGYLRDIVREMADPKTTASLEAIIVEARTMSIEGQRMDQLWLAYTVAGKVLRDILGLEWLERHVLGKEAPTDFFRNDWATDARRTVHMLRVIHLAEMLLNLRQAPGSVHVMKRLQEGGDIESTFAELEVGKLLFIYRVPFRFVVPKEIKGSDYDIELKVGEYLVCADVKHRLETTPEGEDTLLKLLSRAANRQLPADKPGAFFVSLPQSWNQDGQQDRHLQTFESIAHRLWGITRRVVSVVFYFSLALDFEGDTAPIILISEFTSTTHRFDKNSDWSIIKNRGDIVKAIPDSWLDLIRMCA